MRLLLDTSYVYRMLSTPPELTAAEEKFLGDPAEVFVSVASIWEMRIKYNSRHRSGARKSSLDPEGVMEALEAGGIDLLPIAAAHVAKPLNTPLRHKDPFDEILLVQAQEEGLRLLTSDRALLSHPLALSA